MTVDGNDSNFAEEKSKVCMNRCNFCFQATKTTTSRPTTDKEELEEVMVEKIDSAILFCTFCGFIDDIKFE